MIRLAPLFLWLLVSGCYFGKTKDGRTWDAERVSRIEPGRTTKAELLALLGPPQEIVRLLESEAYVYTHTVEKDTGTFLLLVNFRRTDRQEDAVTVIVNRKDIVTAVGSRFSAEQAGYGLPWQD